MVDEGTDQLFNFPKYIPAIRTAVWLPWSLLKYIFITVSSSPLPIRLGVIRDTAPVAASSCPSFPPATSIYLMIMMMMMMMMIDGHSEMSCRWQLVSTCQAFYSRAVYNIATGSGVCVNQEPLEVNSDLIPSLSGIIAEHFNLRWQWYYNDNNNNRRSWCDGCVSGAPKFLRAQLVRGAGSSISIDK